MDSDFCFLFGSKTAPEYCLDGILNAVENCYTKHRIRTFVVGHYGSFDRIAAHALSLLKARRKDINLLLLVPYHPSIRPIDPYPGFQTYYPDGQETVLPKFAITAANHKMIRECSAVVCYPQGVSNSRNMYEKVLKRKIPVYNVKEILDHNTESPPHTGRA